MAYIGAGGCVVMRSDISEHMHVRYMDSTVTEPMSLMELHRQPGVPVPSSGQRMQLQAESSLFMSCHIPWF